MNTTPEKPVEKQTWWGIHSFRRWLYLICSVCAVYPLMIGMTAAKPLSAGWPLLIMVIFEAVLLVWLVLLRRKAAKKPELTNMLLLAAFLALIGCVLPGCESMLLVCVVPMAVLSLGALLPLLNVMQDVLHFALPDEKNDSHKRKATYISGVTAVVSLAVMTVVSILLVRWLAVLKWGAVLSALMMLLCTLRIPVDNRYIHKLRRYLYSMPDNEPLRKRLEWVFVQPHSRPWLLLALETLLRPIYHYQLKGVENICEDEDNPLIYLCNHGISFGPVACVLHMPSYIRPWSISYIMVDREEAADYMHRYSFGDTNKLIPEPLKWPVSRWVARFSIWALNQLLEAVPVFRDKPRQLMNTFRISSDAMVSGDQLLIFPENPNAVCQDHGYEPEGLGELFSGFAMIAPIYYNRTGKCARFMPMYAHPKMRTLSFGREIVFDPDNDPTDERKRIMQETEAQMRYMMEREEMLYRSRKH